MVLLHIHKNDVSVTSLMMILRLQRRRIDLVSVKCCRISQTKRNAGNLKNSAKEIRMEFRVIAKL